MKYYDRISDILSLINMEKFIIYCDGASRGNPGPASIGALIQNNEEKIIKRIGEEIGIKTNNEAEYEAIIFALKKLKQLISKDKTKKAGVEIRLDSELVASQLNGKFKIKEKNLVPLFIKVWNLKTDFKNISFRQIPREKNREADRLANEALNQKQTAPLF